MRNPTPTLTLPLKGEGIFPKIERRCLAEGLG